MPHWVRHPVLEWGGLCLPPWHILEASQLHSQTESVCQCCSWNRHDSCWQNTQQHNKGQHNQGHDNQWQNMTNLGEMNMVWAFFTNSISALLPVELLVYKDTPSGVETREPLCLLSGDVMFIRCGWWTWLASLGDATASPWKLPLATPQPVMMMDVQTSPTQPVASPPTSHYIIS